MSRLVVTVTRRLPTEVEAEIAEAFDARLNPGDRPLDAEGLREALRRSDAVLCTVTDRLPAEVLRVEPRRAKLLANFGVGHDHVDLSAARALGIAVTNTPGVLTEDTAELEVLLMQMVARRVGEGERLLRAGRWTGWAPTQLLGRRLAGRTLGIVGFGRIGRAVARRALALGMRVLYQQPRAAEAGDLPVERCATLEDLLAAADVVSLHCPATPETRHLIDATRLAQMRPTAVLVNTARGDVVDERALVEALRAGRLAGAGLDVYEGEPRVTPELLELESVVLLPHLGSATLEARVAMGRRALANLRAFAAGDPLPDRVA